MSDVRITPLTDGPLEVDGEVSIMAPTPGSSGRSATLASDPSDC